MDDQLDLRRALRQVLSGWKSAGVTHLPPPEPVPAPADAASNVQAVTTGEEPSGEQEMANTIRTAPDRESRLMAIQQRVALCTRCEELARTRTQTVFGIGNPNARVMFIGEAPGADEDAQGIPFVGRAGQLLTKIIEACGWKREDVYICNILRCRPPENRTPTREEADSCREYLDGQIEIVDPDYIVCLGACAAQNLLGTTDSIGRMRGRFLTYGRAKVLCTYHPSYLLRNPEAKKPVWDDMKYLLAEMGLKPPKG